MSQKVDGKMIFTDYWKGLVLNFSVIRNSVIFQQKFWWKDDIYMVFLSFLWYSRTWKIWFFAQCNNHIYLISLGRERIKICPDAIILYQIILKTTICYFYHSFSSSDMHQSITRSGCQAMGRNSSFVFFFWALRFW